MKTFLISLMISGGLHGVALVWLYQGTAAHRVEASLPQPAGWVSVRIVPTPPAAPAAAPAADPAPSLHREASVLLPEAEALEASTEPPAPAEDRPAVVPSLSDAASSPRPESAAPQPKPTPDAENHPMESSTTEPPTPMLASSKPTPPSAAWIEAGVREVLDHAAPSFVYPARCIADGCNGRVRLGITVGPTGRVLGVQAMNSTTYCAHLTQSCVHQTRDILADTWFLKQGTAPAKELLVVYDVIWRITD